MKRALLAALLAACAAHAQRPGLHVARGVHDGIYYGRATAVDLRTLDIIPYDQRPAAPIPDPALIMRDLDIAQRIAVDRFGRKAQAPAASRGPGGALAILLSCAGTLGFGLLAMRRPRPDEI